MPNDVVDAVTLHVDALLDHDRGHRD
jgi:hypothetical protein